ncbi:hypothetical protein [Desulfitobacterium dehalogenans]|nr:hypothetical protein [Desulfitobacterium dehalogenans]
MKTLRNEIIRKAAELAHKNDPYLTKHECASEYYDQFEDGSYELWLRGWLGLMIEDGSKEAIEIMKDLIRYRLQSKPNTPA